METALSVRAAGRGSRGLNVSIKKKKTYKKLMLILNRECAEAREKPEKSGAWVAKNRERFSLLDERKTECC